MRCSNWGASRLDPLLVVFIVYEIAFTIYKLDGNVRPLYFPVCSICTFT